MNTPCGVAEGDCDDDSDCAGDLVCGDNNCGWPGSDDCCKPKSKNIYTPYTPSGLVVMTVVKLKVRTFIPLIHLLAW